MPQQERRNLRARSAIVQRLSASLIENPSVTLSVETLRVWLNVPVDAAERILAKLIATGLVREIQEGLWVPTTRIGA